MNPTTQRAAQASVCLAILLPGCSQEPRFPLQVMVLDCYTASDVRVAIDGTPLALTPPNQRDDSTAVCYDGQLTLGAEVGIDIQSRGQNRHFTVRPDAQKRYLLIDPVQPPFVRLERSAPLID